MENENEVTSAEETTEVAEETTSTEEHDSSEESGEDEQGNGGDNQPFKDQQRRAKKAETARDTYKQRLIDAGLDPDTGKKKSTATQTGGAALSDDDRGSIKRSGDLAERAALRSLGITHAEDIAFVRKQAKHFDGDVEAAAEDEFVKSKLDRMRAARANNDATPAPNKRGGASRTTKLPDFSKMSNAEFDEWEKKNR